MTCDVLTPPCDAVRLQAAVGGVAPRDEVRRVGLAAPLRGGHGGLHRGVGPAAAQLDRGPPAGAAGPTPAPERGKTELGRTRVFFNSSVLMSGPQISDRVVLVPLVFGGPVKVTVLFSLVVSECVCVSMSVFVGIVQLCVQCTLHSKLCSIRKTLLCCVLFQSKSPFDRTVC